MRITDGLALVVCLALFAAVAAGCQRDTQAEEKAPRPRRPKPEVNLTGRLSPRHLWGGRTAAQWLDDLDSPEAETRSRAVVHLGSVGTEALPVLLWALEDENPGVRAVTVSQLQFLSGEEARLAPILRDLAARDAPEVSHAAIVTLSRLAYSGRSEPLAALVDLTKAKKPKVRDAAVEALGSALRITEPAVLRLLELAAAEPGTVLGKKAAESLKALGVRAVPGLLSGMEDPRLPVAQFAAATLASLRDRAPSAEYAVRDLAKRLRSARWTVRWAAAGFLADMGSAGKAAAPELVLALDDEVAAVASEAARALGGIGPEEAGALPALIRTLKSAGREASVRSAAGGALLSLAGRRDEVLLALIETLPMRLRAGKLPGVPRDLEEPGTDDLRAEVRSWIGDLGPASVPALRNALRHEDPIVRQAAVYLLGTVGTGAEPALDDLVVALTDRDPNVRAEAASAIGALGSTASRAAPALRRAWRDEDGRVRAAAVRGLRQVGLDPAIDAAPLADLLAEGETRYEAALAVAGLGGEDAARAVPILISAATALFGAKAEAEDALVRLGAAAVPELLRALEGAQRKSLEFANIAGILGRIGPDASAAVPTLLAALANENSIIRLNAVRALGGIGPGARAALEGLKARLEDPDSGVRAAAKEALSAVEAGVADP